MIDIRAGTHNVLTKHSVMMHGLIIALKMEVLI